MLHVALIVKDYEDYGTVAMFEDLYCNLWDLIQPV